ncbi:MAG: alpha/beta hydrolase [Chromatiales bacterium]|nr:alpha/beta hydrolase [Chromatiales bacterium]
MRQLAPVLEAWLEKHNQLVEQLKISGFKQTPTNAREGLANLTWMLVKERPDIALIQDDLVVGDEFDVPVRIYHPEPDSSLPVLIYFHGGGHMSGGITVYDPICRKIALATNHIVISVDYRLAPECPYPAGLVDALTVAKNIWTTLEPRDIDYQRELAIAGDSAGGAICATLSHTTQHDPAVEIKKQILIYPSLDYTMQHESVVLNGQGYLLEKEKIEWFFDNYFQNGENRQSLSPLHMAFSNKLPESLVVTAEFCPLRDEGFVYVEKLKHADVAHKHIHFDDMIHAFINMEDLLKESCNKLYREIKEFLCFNA